MASAAEQAAALAKLPGLAPPPGVIPNFEDPYSQSDLVVLTTAITFAVATLFILLRTYTKYAIHKSGLGWDDYLSFVAWVGFTAYAFITFRAVKYGAFVHQWNVPAINVMHFLKIVYTVEILYSPIILLTKLSILLQLLHLFAPGNRGGTYYVCHFLVWFNVLFYAVTMFVTIFQCSPRAKFWNPTLPGHCVNINMVNTIAAAINAGSDIVLLVLPIVSVWKLQMSLNKKIGASAVFATASFACVSSVMRLVASIRFWGNKDVTWGIMSEGLWTEAEISSGIICGCMTTLPQFFRHYIPKIRNGLGSRSRGNETGLASSGVYTKQSDRLRAVSHAESSNQYTELDEQEHRLKDYDSSGKSTRIWTDEVSSNSAMDEERGSTRNIGHQSWG